jgi:hypothetical protein
LIIEVRGNGKIGDRRGAIAGVTSEDRSDGTDARLERDAALAPEQWFAVESYKLLGLAEPS